MRAIERRRGYKHVGGEADLNALKYLTFTAIDSGTFKFTKALEYSVDEGTTWVSLAANTATPTVNSGNSIMFKATITPVSNVGVGTFSATADYGATGNPMSLLFGDNFKGIKSLAGKRYAFYKLFYASNVSTSNHLISANISLPATTLSDYCYTQMFYNCAWATEFPKLPATTLADHCYDSMFRACLAMTVAPELPATNINSYCYSSMFEACRSLTSAPALPATTLKSSCYSSMFSSCTSLTASPTLPSTTLASSCYNSMFSSTNVLPDCTNIDFTSATVVNSGGLAGLFYGTKVTDNDLERILPKDSNNHYCLPVSTLSSVGVYNGMFGMCTLLVTAPKLPATTLTNNCYTGMFNGCTSLVNAPDLPATTLKSNCYASMFYGCTSLVTAPRLSGTVLADYCYNSMFRGCSSLTTPPELPVETLKTSCYYWMFYNCTSLTTAPDLPATTLAASCYNSMFYGCSRLTTAPELLATTLIGNCYTKMFYGCSSLNYIKALFTTTPSTTYTKDWVKNVSATGTFVKNSAATWTDTGVNAVPTGWTIQTASS